MSRKHVISKKFIDSLTVNSNQTSEILNVAQTDKASIHLTWSGGSSPDIDVLVQVKNGEADSFRSLDFGAVISITGASGEHEIILNEMPFTNIQLVLNHNSGSAVVSASFTFKSVGA